MNRLLLFTAIFIFSSVVHAQPGKPVRLKHSTLYPVFNVTQGYIDSFNTYLVQAGGAAIAVIQFDAIPSEADRKTLGAAGVELLDYIPEHAYSASITKRLDKNLLLGVRARSLVRLQPAQKMDKYLARGIVPLWSVKVAGTMDAWISFPKSYSTGEVSTLFRQKNIDVVSQDYAGWRILVIRFAPARMQEIAALPFVEYLQAAPPKDQTLNRNSRSASRAGMLNASVANGGKGLNGENVVVGIGDNADIQNHVDFTGRLINRAGTFISSHGQHVSGTVGGGGIINELHRGYAPKATIVSQYFSRILVNAATYVNDFGMVITNNSYGDIIECDYHGTYDLTSRVLDQMAYDLPNLQNIFAAGNSGNSTCAPFATGFRTVLGSYQTAKNVITVGAASDSGFIAGFSSKGPVRDGRIKPEIAAMGQGVISTVPNNSYGSNNGTSMASPGVSGGVALLYQRYRQLHAGANPKNALIKALLVNGATDRGNEGPDYQYGFGLMNLWRSVKMMEDNTYFTGSSTQAVTSTHTISVPANTAQLKVLLYWNDPAAALVSSQALVNDLDLEVTTPSLATILPRILDTAIANVGNTATSGVDRINNIEQVIINNPAAGTYTLKVKGSTIAQNPSQEYFLVYDAIPVHLEVTGPAGGQPLVPGELAKISWDAYGFSSGTVLLEYSLNNGSSWSTIASGININRFNYSWWVPAASTVEALVRVTKEGTGETATSQRFTILGQPVVSLATVQCEDYISISWTPVAGASDYEVMMLRSDSMQQVTLTAATSHLFTGLSKDSTYWVSVRARMNGTAGRRANAVSRKPDSGTCAGTISDNDMKVDAIVSPVTGRQFTSSQLSATAAVSVRVKNLDDAATGNFDVSYSVNGGAWITETVSTPLAAGASYTHTFSATADMATTGTYNIVAVVTNQAADAIAANDTLRAAIRHIANQPLNLVTEFLDNLESADASEYIRDITGMGGAERYDLTRNTVYGRARTFINSGIAWSGNRAITLDVDRYATGNINYLYGTFNLVNYNVTANDIRLDFRYLNHGQGSNAANRVWIRGSDADAWIAVYDLYANQLDPGAYRKTSSIELSDLLAANGQVFTPSFQVRWGQAGVLAASDRSSSSGYTFDDIRLYEVFNDVQLLSLDSPFVASCGLTNATGIRVTVRNSASSALTNVPVRYRINNNAWISEVIPSIAANTTVQYTFAATADFSAYGPYTVQALVDYSADSFHDNDTLTTTVHHAPVISTFPYLQNFEAGNGFWFTGGRKSSWEYGTPASTKINGAASGSRAWKTTLEGGYHDDELSYLYSPCFDVTGMTTPTLSFSVALDIEDCGATLCDAAWVEYSAD
ncbi:MAG TPA: S8 family serine peptidase, partial [Flavisolibacter sp.]